MASNLPHVKWPERRTPFGRRAGILRPMIHPVVFNNLSSPASTPCSCSCDFLSSCLTTTSINDDYYPLLGLLGYPRYGSILAIVGSKCLFSGDTTCGLAIYIELSGEGDISSGVQGGVFSIVFCACSLGREDKGVPGWCPRSIHTRGCLICRWWRPRLSWS